MDLVQTDRRVKVAGIEYSINEYTNEVTDLVSGLVIGTWDPETLGIQFFSNYRIEEDWVPKEDIDYLEGDAESVILDPDYLEEFEQMKRDAGIEFEENLAMTWEPNLLMASYDGRSFTIHLDTNEVFDSVGENVGRYDPEKEEIILIAQGGTPVPPLHIGVQDGVEFLVPTPPSPRSPVGLPEEADEVYGGGGSDSMYKRKKYKKSKRKKSKRKKSKRKNTKQKKSKRKNKSKKKYSF